MRATASDPVVEPRAATPWTGPASALALLAGALLALQPADLPPVAVAAGLLAAGCVFGWWPRLRLPALLLLGIGWTLLQADRALDARLDPQQEGRDLMLEGRVSGLPERDTAQRRFDFRVTAPGDSGLARGSLLRLAWYGDAPSLEPGSTWRLQLRLKRPRGGVNPGGFDYERWALQRGLVATGYVRDHRDNAMLSDGRGVDALRARLSRAIEAAVGAPRARFVQALALGDTRALDDHDWDVLRATGITHLIAISGLHVGLVAGFGALLALMLYRLWPRLGLHLPLPQGAALCALMAAGGYSLLAGFSLPTVRTLLMIAVVLLAVLLRRAVDTWQALSLALIAILVADPLALLGAGFWLSFLGVAWLVWCLPRRPRRGWRAALGTLASAQGVMTIGLLPLTVWFFGQASLVGPLVNLIAVPWVSFVVVPLALAGTGLELCFSGAGTPLFVAAGALMQALWSLAEPAAALHGALLWLPESGPLAFALAGLGAFWSLLPRAVPGRGLALLLFVPLLWPARTDPGSGEVELVVFDVGQGLSLLVRTRSHALLYDAGPARPGGLDLGEAAVVPGLRALGVGRLDAYIESHGDNDHAGGSDAVLRAFTPDSVWASDPARGAMPCVAGVRWRWDGVDFEFLHPPPEFPYLRNDSSCVLRVQTAGGALLLPGDIGEVIEQRLLRERPDALAARVLLVPHHGSRSSSSAAFVAAVNPGHALIASGHRNRFGLPRPEIVQRYEAASAVVLDTAASGAIRLLAGNDGIRVDTCWRLDRRRLWHEGP